ncbi:MAG TPA: hypothetical protein DEB74_00780 [Lachnospiraceae bacterium]|nr:hypothetical protein [Lachnospiraceae bacterium]
MQLRNEINKIGVNINQIVKNNNSHIYREDDKIQLEQNICEIKEYVQILIEKKNMN